MRKYPWRWNFDFLLGVLLIAIAIFLNLPQWLRIVSFSVGFLSIVLFACLYAHETADRKK